MRFTETTSLSHGAGERAERRRRGLFEFDAGGGVKALDVTTSGGEYGRERVIGFNDDIGGTGYQSGGLAGKWLKKGKTWWKDSPPRRAGRQPSRARDPGRPARIKLQLAAANCVIFRTALDMTDDIVWLSPCPFARQPVAVRRWV